MIEYLIALAIIAFSVIGWRVGGHLAKQQINRQKLAQVTNKV